MLCQDILWTPSMFIQNKAKKSLLNFRLQAQQVKQWYKNTVFYYGRGNKISSKAAKYRRLRTIRVYNPCLAVILYCCFCRLLLRILESDWLLSNLHLLVLWLLW
jgi:hypothetical protein